MAADLTERRGMQSLVLLISFHRHFWLGRHNTVTYKLMMLVTFSLGGDT